MASQAAEVYGGGADQSPLVAFFSLYSDFHHNSAASPSSEFYRLVNEMGWDWNSGERLEAHQEYKDALTMEFNIIYGTDERDIQSWHRLCSVLGIPPPDGLKASRQAVLSAHVNLVDLVWSRGEGVVEIFPSEKALSEYTISSGKFFPSDEARAGGVLRYLLRHILHPRDENTRGRGGKRGRGRARGGRARGRGRRGPEVS
ncbi:hypothetical protein FA95DRAFT_1503284 [Auriscalpium vulgare]|uniref:Uncharacterized protein n=1 Tax=Auriscalpium vulgare TaxID=40419 RepID=A0ACB8R7P5_9AGAM|nr:hypothetical protein FA95DRAFT_1503284 [Auriscalpium vulgare]